MTNNRLKVGNDGDKPNNTDERKKARKKIRF